MTPIAIIEFIIIWLFISTWICRKRNWYDNFYGEEKSLAIVGAYLLMPIILIVALIREFIGRDWNFYK